MQPIYYLFSLFFFFFPTSFLYTKMANCLVSLPTHIFTLQDIVLDSPVWRTNMIHLEDQIDQYEKWLDGFIRYLKSYIESIISKTFCFLLLLFFNISFCVECQQQASNLCKRTFLSGIDCALMGK